jgi:hypothetical protein
VERVAAVLAVEAKHPVPAELDLSVSFLLVVLNHREPVERAPILHPPDCVAALGIERRGIESLVTLPSPDQPIQPFVRFGDHRHRQRRHCHPPWAAPRPLANLKEFRTTRKG